MRLQRAADVGDRHAQRRGAFPINIHQKTRRGGLIVLARPDQVRIAFGDVGDQAIRLTVEHVVVGALQDELDVVAAPAAAQGRAHGDEGPHAGQLSETRIDLVDDLITRTTLVPVRHAADDDPGIIARSAPSRRHNQHPAQLASLEIAVHDLFGLHHLAGHVIKAGALMRLNETEEASAIRRRGQLARQL